MSVEKGIDLALTTVVCLMCDMKLKNGKLSLKEKILLSVVFCVDKDKNVPFDNLSFPFAPEITLDKLFDWVFCQRSVFYSTISRMVRDGLINVENGVVKLAEKGKKILATNFPYLFLKNQKWDGNWGIIVFNIKESERYKRDKLRNYLIKVKFAPLSHGVWVSASRVKIDNEGTIYIEGKLQARELEKILQYYRINEINSEYERLCEAFKTAKDLQEYDRIPILKSQFLEVFANDPELPSELLPKSWAGEKAKRMFLK